MNIIIQINITEPHVDIIKRRLRKMAVSQNTDDVYIIVSTDFIESSQLVS